jgi:hypothetical protein
MPPLLLSLFESLCFPKEKRGSSDSVRIESLEKSRPQPQRFSISYKISYIDPSRSLFHHAMKTPRNQQQTPSRRNLAPALSVCQFHPECPRQSCPDTRRPDKRRPQHDVFVWAAPSPTKSSPLPAGTEHEQCQGFSFIPAAAGVEVDGFAEFVAVARGIQHGHVAERCSKQPVRSPPCVFDSPIPPPKMPIALPDIGLRADILEEFHVYVRLHEIRRPLRQNFLKKLQSSID